MKTLIQVLCQFVTRWYTLYFVRNIMFGTERVCPFSIHECRASTNGSVRFRTGVFS